MLEAGICPMRMNHCRNLLSGDFAVVRRQPQHLMSGCLNCTGFVNIDMGAFRTNDPLMGPQRSRNHRQVGLCAANQKMHRQILISANCTNLPGSFSAISILTITRCLLHIGLYQGFQYLFVTAFAVIIVKIDHKILQSVFSHFNHSESSCQGCISPILFA